VEQQAMTLRTLSATLLLAFMMMLAVPDGAQAGDSVLPPADAVGLAAAAGWAEARSFSSPDATYRSCRRQVRRAAGIIPSRRMRLPRAWHLFIDRCVANGGVYS
jgi:hypothetical protein